MSTSMELLLNPILAVGENIPLVPGRERCFPVVYRVGDVKIDPFKRSVLYTKNVKEEYFAKDLRRP